MQPQARRKKPQPQQAAARNGVPTRIPVTEKGQKYVAPAGRHSQQTHLRGQEQAAAGGHMTEKEHHAATREATINAIANRAAQKTQHQERSKPK